MIGREALRGFLQIGFFVGGLGVFMALALPTDSPEYVVSVCSASIGLLLIVAVIVVARFTR